MRLDKYLADLQVGTRSQVKEYVKKGLVSVNGQVVKKADIKIDEMKDEVCYQDKRLIYQKYRYYLLYKPAGVVTATKDNIDKTVIDLLPKELTKDIFPVGRLDKDTEGLLLLTNDGELSHNLLSPKKHVAKTYYVECDGQLDDIKIEQLCNGVDIGDDSVTLPAQIEVIEQQSDRYVIKLTITEGRFHQVKRMVQAIGGQVTYLKRLSMGKLVLDEGLEKGAFRELTSEEIDALKQ